MAESVMRSNLKLFEERVRAAYNLIARVPSDFRRGAFLDVGCGIGNGVIAALMHGASFAVGIDADLGEFADLPRDRIVSGQPRDFVPEEMSAIFRHFKVDFARALLIEASIFDLKFSPAPFHLALMQDSIEHVPEPQRFIHYIHDVLEPGGFFVLDACPLYYSPEGHHLFHCFDAATDPWPHLRPDFEARIQELGVTEWHLRNLHSLNKVTHGQVIAAFQSAGFVILQEDRAKEDANKTALFQKYGHLIDPSLKIERQWLFEDRITVLARKPPASAVGNATPRQQKLSKLRRWAKGSLGGLSGLHWIKPKIRS
jgi:SAM-dependent methyltransferase